jgi:hypothetical protein
VSPAASRRLTRASVLVNGRRRTLLRTRRALRRGVALRLTRDATVTIAGRDAKGRRVTTRRRYRVCR